MHPEQSWFFLDSGIWEQYSFGYQRSTVVTSARFLMWMGNGVDKGKEGRKTFHNAYFMLFGFLIL
jgi:hypothetical protein